MYILEMKTWGLQNSFKSYPQTWGNKSFVPLCRVTENLGGGGDSMHENIWLNPLNATSRIAPKGKTYVAHQEQVHLKNSKIVKTFSMQFCKKKTSNRSWHMKGT